MATVTVAHLLHAYTKPPKSSVWVIPGTLDDFENSANEERYPHIDEYLVQRGIRIASHVSPDEADEIEVPPK